MFRFLENQELDEWFQRLNAPLQGLPAGDRAELHLEVRQHLESLAAANEELGSTPEEAWRHALAQFGDPARIGKRLFQEWQQSRDWSPDGGRSILFGIGRHLMLTLFSGMPVALWAHYPGLLGLLNRDNPPSWNAFFGIGAALLVNAAIGLKYPFQAIKGALYAGLFWRIVFLARLAPLLLPSQSAGLVGDFVLWSALDCAVAYLAGATKRGWYRPQLADFKLMLPWGRRQVTR